MRISPIRLDQLAVGLIGILVFTIPWANLVVVPGVGTIQRIAGIALIGPLLAVAVIRGRIYINRFSILGGVFLSWFLASALWSHDSAASINAATSLASYILMAALIVAYVKHETDRNNLLWAYLLGAAVSAVFLFLEFTASGQGSSIRSTADGFNPNDLALILGAGAIIGLYLSGRPSISRVKRLLAISIVFSLVVATVLTGSRGGLVALVVAGGGFVALSLRSQSRLVEFVAPLTLLLLAAIGALFIVPDAVFERLGETGTELTSGAVSGRGEIWLAGWRALPDHVWIGTGLGTFPTVVQDQLGLPKSPHNSLLGLTLEGGLVGGVLWLSILIAIVSKIRRAKPPARPLFGALLLLVLMASLVNDVHYHAATWLFFALIGGLVAGGKSAAPEGPPRPIEANAGNQRAGAME